MFNKKIKSVFALLLTATLINTNIAAYAAAQEVPKNTENIVTDTINDDKEVQESTPEDESTDEEADTSKNQEITITLTKKEEHGQYINGANGQFRPKDFLTRAEFCVILNTIYQLTDNGFNNEFEDVADDAWYNEYVKKVSECGIMKGYPDGGFNPQGHLSRAEFISALCVSFEDEEKDAVFSDIETHWAKNQIVYAYENGWINGYKDGTFLPNAPISRAEAVVVINRILQRSAANSKNMLIENFVNPFCDLRNTDWYYADVMEATIAHTHTGENTDEVWNTFEYKSSGFKNTLAFINNKGYLTDSNGQFKFLESKNGFVDLDGKKYYTTGDGAVNAYTGLKEIDGSMYYFKEDKSILTDGNYENLYFGSDGKYTCGNAELDALVDEALAKCTNNSMEKWEKLRASYLYLRDNCKYLSRSHHPRGATEFVEESATFMFKNNRGNCYCYASCFLLMAKRIGYSNAYIVSGGVGTNNSDHAWVMINSKIFDPELEYAYRYRYATKRYFNLYDMDVSATPFPYYFP